MTPDITGLWWLPESPEQRVAGTLSPQGDTWRLKLLGALPGTEADTDRLRSTDFEAPPPPVRTILGDGPTTVRQCHENGWRGQGERVVEQDWLCLEVFQGAHIDEDARFGATRFSVDGLAEWFGPGGLSGRSFEGRTDVWRYEHPEPLNVDFAGSRLTVNADISTRTSRRLLDVQELVTVTVEAEIPVSTHEWHDQWLRPMAYLLTLVAQEYCQTHNAQFWESTEDWLNRVDELQARAAKEAPRRRWELWLRDTDVDPPAFLTGWLRLCRRHSTALDLACANFDSSAGFMHSQLLNAVTAAEALDRGLHDDMPTDAQLARLERVTEGLTGADRKWVRGRLRNAHEPNLATRLLRTVRPIGEFAEWLVGDVTAWAEAAARARNGLAHRVAGKPDPEDDPDQIIRLSRSTEALVQARLLAEAGAEPAVLAERARRLPRFIALAAGNDRIATW